MSDSFRSDHNTMLIYTKGNKICIVTDKVPTKSMSNRKEET